jgi:hypothetical protein
MKWSRVSRPAMTGLVAAMLAAAALAATSIGSQTSTANAASLVTGGVIGDITGDGLPDILAINNSTGNLYLYPATSVGGIPSFGTPTEVGQGWSNLTLAAVGNLNGTREREGILALDHHGNLWYYPNIGGTRPFGTPTQVGQGFSGYRVVGLTDLSADNGAPGLLAIDRHGNLWYYPNAGGTGPNTFGARIQVGSGWTRYTADVEDINGDGYPDILALNNSDGNLYYYQNNGPLFPIGMNTFTEIARVSSGWSAFQAVDLGYFTENDFADILAIDPDGNLLYYPNHGGGSFGAPTQVGQGWTGYTIN